MYRDVITELYRTHNKMNDLLLDLPDNSSSRQVRTTLRLLWRELSKLDETMVCPLCGKDINDGDEITHYYKQAVHSKCHIPNKIRAG